MRRYKPPTDPRWHPYRESQPKKGKGFNPSTQSTISLMNCLEASPAKMAIVAPDPFSHALPLSPLSKTTTFLDSKLLIFSTPPQGARTSF